MKLTVKPYEICAIFINYQLLFFKHKRNELKREIHTNKFYTLRNSNINFYQIENLEQMNGVDI